MSGQNVSAVLMTTAMGPHLETVEDPRSCRRRSGRPPCMVGITATTASQMSVAAMSGVQPAASRAAFTDVHGVIGVGGELVGGIAEQSPGSS